MKSSVSTLNLLGMTQIRPLLIAILSKFESKNVSMAFRKLLSVAIRYQMVGGVGGGTLERIYSETAKSVSEEKISSAAELMQAFKNVPSDTAFRSAFAIASVSKQKIARYYLRELEIEVADKDVEKIPDDDVSRVNLEHVLPSNPTGDWLKNFNDEELRTYQNRLGNLAILATRINSTIGNDCFEDKSASYKDSSFHFTKIISDEPVWNKDAIEKRQEKMADVAVKRWSI